MRLSNDSIAYLRPLISPRVLADKVITDDERLDPTVYLVPVSSWLGGETIDASRAQTLLARALIAYGTGIKADAHTARPALEHLYATSTDPNERFRAAEALGDTQKRDVAMDVLLAKGGDPLKVLRAHKVGDLEAARYLSRDLAQTLSAEHLDALLTAMPKLGLDPSKDLAASLGSASYHRSWTLPSTIEALLKVTHKTELAHLFAIAASQGIERFLFAERALTLLDQSPDRATTLAHLETAMRGASPARAAFLFESLTEPWLKGSELPALLDVMKNIEKITDPKVRRAAHNAIGKTPMAELSLTVAALAKTPLSSKDIPLLEAFQWRAVSFADAVSFARALGRTVHADDAYEVTLAIEGALKRGLSPVDALAEARALIVLSPHHIRAIYDLCEDLGIDVRTMTKKNAAKTVLAAWTKNPGKYTTLAAGIDALHEGELGSDSIRKDIIAGLPEVALYRLAAQARSGSFTSTFKLMEKRLATLDAGFITRVDPKGDELRAFVQTLCAFQGDGLLLKWQDALRETLFDSLFVGNNDERMLVSGSFIALMKAGSEQTRTYLENRMLQVITTEHDDERATMVFVLKHAQRLGVPLAPATVTAISQFPDVASVTAPTQAWLKDGVLSVQMFYYPDEKSIDITAHELRKEGFTRRVEKGLTSKDTYVYERRVNGIKQRIVLSRDGNLDRSKPFDDASVDVVVHRGHSYHFDETFPERTHATTTRKLVIGGSCGSFRSMTDASFLDAYGSNLLIADVDTGTGYVNDKVLVRLLAALTRGESDFTKMGLSDLVKGQGIRLPTEPAMQFATYLAAVRAALP